MPGGERGRYGVGASGLISFSCFNSAHSASGISWLHVADVVGDLLRAEGAGDHRRDQRMVERELEGGGGERDAVALADGFDALRPARLPPALPGDS